MVKSAHRLSQLLTKAAMTSRLSSEISLQRAAYCFCHTAAHALKGLAPPPSVTARVRTHAAGGIPALSYLVETPTSLAAPLSAGTLPVPRHTRFGVPLKSPHLFTRLPLSQKVRASTLPHFLNFTSAFDWIAHDYCRRHSAPCCARA